MTTPAAMASVTPQELLARIAKESGADLENLPMGHQIVWYAPADTVRDANASPQPLVVRLGEPYPLFDKHIVVGLFQDENEFRVYTIAAANKMTADKPQDANPRVCHLSKKGPVYYVKRMPLDAFVTEIATDWSIVAYDMTPIDRARTLIADFVRENSTAPFDKRLSTEDLAEAIENGDYDDEEEEEEDPEPTGDPPPPPSPPSSTGSPGVQ